MPIADSPTVTHLARLFEWPGNRDVLAYCVLALTLGIVTWFSISHEPHGIPGRRAGQVVAFDWSASEVEQWAGRADVGSYIRGAKYFLEHGKFYASTINLWPPGHTYLVATIIRFSGENYYPAKILGLNLAFWMLAFALVYDSLRPLHFGVLRLVLTMAPFYFDNIRSWVFGYGLLGSESFAHPLFIVSICLFVRWVRSNDARNLFAMGFVMAVLAYLRGYFEMMGNIMVVGVFAIAFAQLLGRVAFVGEGGAKPMRVFKDVIRHPWRALGPRVRAALIAALVFIVLLLPWRLYNLERGNSLSWIHANYYWAAIWQPDSAANRLYVNLGINIPCHVDPQVCEALHRGGVFKSDPRRAQSFYKKLTVVTFLSNPLKWYSHRAKYFQVFWFGSSWEALYKKHHKRLYEGVFLLSSAFLAVVFAFFGAWRGKKTELRLLLTYVMLFTLFNCVLFTFLHFQYRYSIFIRIFCAYLPLWVWAYSIRDRGDSASRAAQA